MNRQTTIISIILTLTIVLAAWLLAGKPHNDSHVGHGHGHGDEHTDEVVKGPHNGRLLSDGDFVLELAIFETGVPPEFRVWATYQGQAIKPSELDLNIKLTRLGDKVDHIRFKPHGDGLRGDTVIYEPHSFVVTIDALYQGNKYSWQYDNLEGRTKIETEVAKALEIETEVAGSAVITETVTAYGKLVPNAERHRDIRARFAGEIKAVNVSVGDKVQQGQVLASIESNESLNLYLVKAPISGVISQRNANPGEQTDNRVLFSITDPNSVWAELAIFPADRARVQTGAVVSIKPAASEQTINGVINNISVIAADNQAVIARVVLDNRDSKLIPGTYVEARIKVAEHPVALAVKRSGLQAFRDFTVVYTQIGEEYEVRMLELGKQDDTWVEVLGGLEPGSVYVSGNSYVIKADIEKSGASHDH